MSQTPVLVKPLTQVNTTDEGHQFDGQVAALPDGGYFIVWTDQSGVYNDGDAVVGQRFDSAGNPVGGETSIDRFDLGSRSEPAIAAFTGAIFFGEFVVAYTAVRNGVTIETGGLGISVGDNSFDPAVTTFADGNFVFAYTLGSGEDTDIAYRYVRPGNPGSDRIIFDDPDNSGNVELATLSDGNFVAVFQSEEFGHPANNEIVAAIVDPVANTQLVLPVDFGLANETDPDVAALTGGGFVVVWTDGDSTVTDIRATIYTNDGVVLANQFLVNTTVAGQQDRATVVGLLDGGFVVTWDDAAANLVRAQRFDAAGNPLGDEFTVQDQFGNGDVTRLSDGRIVYTLQELDSELGNFNVVTSIWNPLGVAELGDVLWQHTSGIVATSERELGLAPEGFEVRGTGDFDGDGDTDILLRNGAEVRTWEVVNAAITLESGQPDAGISWEIAGTGDFDGDGDDDVVWLHQEGAVTIWEMAGGTYEINHNQPSASPGWQIAGVGDFDGDGDDDIVWRHEEGAVTIWEMEGNAFVVNHNQPAVPTAWEIADTGDFDGDNDSDILWRRDGGAVTIWEMDNNAFVVNHNQPAVPTAWDAEGTHDFDSDGDDDILSYRRILVTDGIRRQRLELAV